MINPFMRLLRWNAIQYGLVAKSEYDIVYKWYEEKREECEQAREEVSREKKSAQHWYAKYMQVLGLNDDLRARIKKRDELITKLADDLQAANDTIERLSIENDVLTKAARKRKPAARPRTTGARNKKVEVA